MLGIRDCLAELTFESEREPFIFLAASKFWTVTALWIVSALARLKQRSRRPDNIFRLNTGLLD